MLSECLFGWVVKYLINKYLAACTERKLIVEELAERAVVS